ncbi:MAG: Na+/H+ antiporter NhaC family protein [Firmicutes bacterium]|nr:Na+/H+ antiporter NhaC family protein [Bacillota bacterium]
MSDNRGRAKNNETADVTGAPKVENLEFRLGVFGATVPIMFFILWAVITSTLKVSSEQGLVVGAVMGLALGLFLCKSSWKDYAQGLFDGMSQSVGVVAIVAWFWAGMFASILQAGGLVEGLVWLGAATGVEGALFTAITFLLAAVFASAVGTGYGTTVAFTMLMYPAGVVMGADPIVLFAAVLSGAAFGDNLAPVSDTTIVSAVTQETDVPGVVKSRFKYAITAAIPALILFLILGGADGGGVDSASATQMIEQNTDARGLILLIPFALVIYLALSGQHLITSLTWGIVAASALIPLTGLGTVADILWFNTDKGVIEGAIVDGVTGYINMAILILLVVASGYLIQLGGTMDALRKYLAKKIDGVTRRAELSIWGIVAFLNAFITINTAAEIAAAPFVKAIGKDYKIHPYRRANFLDAQTSALGYIFPWSGGVLLGVSTIAGLTEKYDFIHAINPAQAVPFVFHGWFLVLVMLLAAITGMGLRYEGPNGEELKEKPE